jgi:hypothetical protein
MMKKHSLLGLFLCFGTLLVQAQSLYVDAPQRYTSTTLTVWNINGSCYGGAGIKLYVNDQVIPATQGFCVYGICRETYPFGTFTVGDKLYAKDGCGNQSNITYIQDDYVYVETPVNGISPTDESLPYSRLSTAYGVGKCSPIPINSHALHSFKAGFGINSTTTTGTFTSGVFKINGVPISAGDVSINVGASDVPTTVGTVSNGAVSYNGLVSFETNIHFSGRNPVSIEYKHNGVLPFDVQEYFFGPIGLRLWNNNDISYKEYLYDGNILETHLSGNFTNAVFLFTFDQGAFKLYIDGNLIKTIQRTVVYSSSSGAVSNGGVLPYATGITWTPSGSGRQWVGALIDGVRYTRQQFTVADDMVINESTANVACNGGTNGSITVNVSGGQAPFQYALNGGGFTGNNYFGGLNAGTYTIKVRDASGCETSKTVNLTNNPPINLSASSVNVNCAGQNTGSITLNALGGAGFFQYSIDGSTYQNSNVFTNVGAGNYTCYVRDVANCVKTTTATVGLNSTIVANVSATPVKCFGGNDGSISVTTTGSSPAGNLQFSLNNIDYQGGSQFNNLSAGNYTVYIKDNLCSITRTITVAQPSDLVVSLSKTQDVLCYNAPIGSPTGGIIDGNASGGTAPYQFSLDGTTYQPSNHFTGLSIGTYKLWVKDANNCVKQTNQVTLTQPTDLIPSVTSKTDANCFGDSNGTLVVAATGGVSPYVFSIDGTNFQNSPINNLRANTYTLSVKDANGCIKTLQTSIGQPTQLTINLVSKTNLSCYQNKTGRIEVNSSGGTLPYQFAINNTTNASFQSSSVFDQLAANTYTISGKDAHNCPVTLSGVTLTEPTDIFITMLKKKDVDCEYYQRGEALVLATGSNGNFTYTLAGLTFTGNGITPISNRSGYFPQLKAGNYTLTASDQRACGKDFTVTIIPKSTNIGFDITKTLPSNCTTKGGSPPDGSIGVINTRGGRPPYQYGISTQANFSPSPNFSNLLNGNYIITVADSLCSYKQNVDLALPNSLKANYSILPIDCNVSNANLSVSPISGGNGNYQLSLNNGVTSSNGSPSDTFYQNLAPAVYAVTITDQPTTCQTVLSLEIKEQNRADLQLTAKTNIACFGDYSGSITVAGNNNLSPFQYALNNKNNWQNGGTFNNLPAGTYQVYAKNNRGCLDSLTILLTQPTLLVGSLTKEDNLCFGDNTGKIHATSKGGITPYQYSLDGTTYQNSGEFQGLKAGFYTVRVKDNNQCIKSNDIELIQPTLVKVQPIYADTVRCYGETNGRVQVIASGGTPNYQYSKDSLSYFIDNNFTNLKAGNYTFYVKDAHGCIQKNKLAITQPDTLVLNLVQKTHPLCYGTQDGTILVNATGGNRGNVFTLDNTLNQKTPLFTNLTQADYTVRVTDRKGCLNDIKSIPLVWPKAMNAIITTTPPTCVGFSNGSIQVNLQGGTLNYTANLTNAISLPTNPTPINTQTTYDKLSAGDYHITVFDKNACQLILPVKLIQPEALNSIKLGKDTTVCIAQIVTLNANNKGQDISWYYNDKLKAKSDTIHAIATGIYKVVVKNKTGCILSDSIQVKNNKTALIADFLMAIQAFVGDTVVVLDISKPTPDQIIWTLPSQANTIENKMTKLTFVIGEKGDYTIKMLARKGECFNIKERQLGIFRKEDVDATDPTLHYKDYNIIQSITTYPNPNFGKFTVDVVLTKAENADLTITRAGNAQVVYQESKKGQSSYTFEIALKNFAQGVYIVTVRAGVSTLFRNVVIQN